MGSHLHLVPEPPEEPPSATESDERPRPARTALTPSYKAIKTKARRGRTHTRYAAIVRYPNGSVITVPRARFLTPEQARARAAQYIAYLVTVYGTP